MLVALFIGLLFADAAKAHGPSRVVRRGFGGRVVIVDRGFRRDAVVIDRGFHDARGFRGSVVIDRGFHHGGARVFQDQFGRTFIVP
jgi:lipoate-protein ligase A